MISRSHGKLFDRLENAYNVPDLDHLAANIGAWRESKGFVSPGRIGGEIAPEDVAGVSYADLMLSKLMLMVGEIAEAAEAVRRGDFDNFAEELADAIIRILDTCASCGIEISAEIVDKMLKNEARPHKHGKAA